jgi:hypothetical protein
MSRQRTELLWRSADYVLRGEYCPIQQVRGQVEWIRDELNAQVVVHVATDHEVVLRSLTWAVGEPTEFCADLSQRLRCAEYRRDNRATNKLLVQTVRAHDTEDLGTLEPGLADRLFSGLCGVTPRGGGTAGTPPLPRSGWGGLVLSHTGRAAVGPRAGEARSILLVYPGAATPTALQPP